MGEFNRYIILNYLKNTAEHFTMFREITKLLNFSVCVFFLYILFVCVIGICYMGIPPSPSYLDDWMMICQRQSNSIRKNHIQRVYFTHFGLSEHLQLGPPNGAALNVWGCLCFVPRLFLAVSLNLFLH
jgi:hypothetical protein